LALKDSSGKHDDWYGYAELCLFLGKEEEYRLARRALLAKFASADDPYIAERTSRACLLMPISGDELRQAAALADRAVAADRKKYPPGLFYYLHFVKGLAEYRQGRFEQAIAAMRGEASRVPGPAPRLVLAMALHKSGETAPARQALAAAILAYDWRAARVRDQDGWIFHCLRREAERMILPDLPAFLEGKHQPQDRDERLALIGVCQFTNRAVTLARFYTDAFAADSKLADDFRAGHCFNAACAAAQAGRAAELSAPERAKWRAQARQWVRANLAAWKNRLDENLANATTRDRVRQTLTQWQSDPDLAGLREPAELQKLSADERKDCLALWAEINRVLKAAQAK
jgi:serine/threonine-protein kinase